MANKRPQVSGFSGRTAGKMLKASGKPGSAPKPVKAPRKKGK